MKILFFILLAFAVSKSYALETCQQKHGEGAAYVLVESDFEKREINGQIHYVLNKPAEDVERDCINLKQIQQTNQQLEELLAATQQLKNAGQNLADNNQAYQDLIGKYQATLNNSVDLTDQYDDLTANYDKLVDKHQALVAEYDELVAKYRNIALSGSSSLSFEFGAGISDSGDFAGLIGVGTKNLRAWGVVQDDGTTTIMVGTKIDF